MKKIQLILPIFCTLFFVSCKKDPITVTSNPISTTSSSYAFPLSIGSYWIYETLMVDSSENIIAATGSFDSLYVSDDTIINLKTYYILKAATTTFPFFGVNSVVTSTLTNIVRDSLGYIVDTSGNYIKHDDFVNILYTLTENAPDSLYRKGYMTNKDSIVTVPAGTFTTRNYQEKIIRYDSSFMSGIPKYANQVMANSIGIVYKSIPYASFFNKSAIRLIRYNIAP